MLATGNPPDRSAFEHILTQERLITIGRLTPGIVHEINNPLQAIRGALTLALDDIENPRELREYITISQQEIEHITRLLSQVRLIYRSQSDLPELFPLSVLFRDAIDLTREEAMRQKVRVNNLLPSNSPVVEGVYNHIYIAILRTFLAFTDAIGAAGGGELTITAVDDAEGDAEVHPAYLVISFTTRAPIFMRSPDLDPPASKKMIDQFDLASSAELVAANGGVLEFQMSADTVTLCINLPRVP